MRAACSSRRLGRQRERRVRCVRSSCEFRARGGQHVAAFATARKLAVLIWHLLSKGERYVWARPALHARKLRDLELKAVQDRARPKRRGPRVQYQEPSRSGAQMGRASRDASSPVGIRVVPSGCARAPQPRCDDEGCAAGLAPRALLFAARSPIRERKIAQIPQEPHGSVSWASMINTCRLGADASCGWKVIQSFITKSGCQWSALVATSSSASGISRRKITHTSTSIWAMPARSSAPIALRYSVSIRPWVHAKLIR